MKKLQKKTNEVKKFVLFEGHNFFLNKLGTAIYKGRQAFNNLFFDLTYDTRFGRIVREKSPKNGQLIRELTLPKIIAFCVKKYGVVTFA